MQPVAVIPARYASTRFPGKPLALLQGKPIIRHVYERVAGSGLFGQVIVATDDARIAEAVQSFGGSCQITSPDHPSGSDRVAEVVKDIKCDLVFNIQGDEPLIGTEPLAALLAAFSDPEVKVATLITPVTDLEAILNINMVKVIFNNNMDAIYFSRSLIPCNRDGEPGLDYFRHIGVYAFRKQTLLDFVSLPVGRLERAEKLEQLRLLEYGIPIRLVGTSYQGIGIDTLEDLEKVGRLLQI